LICTRRPIVLWPDGIAGQVVEPVAVHAVAGNVDHRAAERERAHVQHDAGEIERAFRVAVKLNDAIEAAPHGGVQEFRVIRRCNEDATRRPVVDRLEQHGDEPL